jgi:hypothetical protein
LMDYVDPNVWSPKNRVFIYTNLAWFWIEGPGSPRRFWIEDRGTLGFRPGAKRLLPVASLAERSRIGDSESKIQ